MQNGFRTGNKFEGLFVFHREGYLKIFPFKMKGYLKNCPSCITRRNRVQINPPCDQAIATRTQKCINKSIWLAPGRYPWCTHGRCPLVANQIVLFMHFLGASRDGLVARRVDLDTISSSVCIEVFVESAHYHVYHLSNVENYNISETKEYTW